jgi:hypothetical protein
MTSQREVQLYDHVITISTNISPRSVRFRIVIWEYLALLTTKEAFKMFKS